MSRIDEMQRICLSNAIRYVLVEIDDPISMDELVSHLYRQASVALFYPRSNYHALVRDTEEIIHNNPQLYGVVDNKYYMY